MIDLQCEIKDLLLNKYDDILGLTQEQALLIQRIMKDIIETYQNIEGTVEITFNDDLYACDSLDKDYIIKMYYILGIDYDSKNLDTLSFLDMVLINLNILTENDIIIQEIIFTKFSLNEAYSFKKTDAFQHKDNLLILIPDDTEYLIDDYSNIYYADTRYGTVLTLNDFKACIMSCKTFQLDEYSEKVYDILSKNLGVLIKDNKDLMQIVKLSSYMLGDIYRNSDKFYQHYDIDEVSSINLEALGSKIGYKWDDDVTAENQRLMIKNYLSLRKKRGSIESIKLACRLYNTNESDYYQNFLKNNLDYIGEHEIKIVEFGVAQEDVTMQFDEDQLQPGIIYVIVPAGHRIDVDYIKKIVTPAGIKLILSSAIQIIIPVEDHRVWHQLIDDREHLTANSKYILEPHRKNKMSYYFAPKYLSQIVSGMEIIPIDDTYKMNNYNSFIEFYMISEKLNNQVQILSLTVGNVSLVLSLKSNQLWVNYSDGVNTVELSAPMEYYDVHYFVRLIQTDSAIVLYLDDDYIDHQYLEPTDHVEYDTIILGDATSNFLLGWLNLNNRYDLFEDAPKENNLRLKNQKGDFISQFLALDNHYADHNIQSPTSNDFNAVPIGDRYKRKYVQKSNQLDTMMTIDYRDPVK